MGTLAATLSLCWGRTTREGHDFYVSFGAAGVARSGGLWLIISGHVPPHSLVVRR